MSAPRTKGESWRQKACARWTAAVLASLTALPAAAVDGEILINQAKINAGGITPGDTAGFPATISRAGHYKLSANLVVPGGVNGIEVTTNDVVIDLNGFTIRSNSPNKIDNAIHAINVNRLRVGNGTITGFAAGIYNLNGRFAVIENTRLIANADGLITQSEAAIRDNTIALGSGGIDCSASCLIQGNTITGNQGIGIRVTEGAVVLGNVIAGNGGYGLAPDNPRSGYGHNVLVGNHAGGAQVLGVPNQLHPNACDPPCP
jgi:hypothetical protein